MTVSPEFKKKTSFDRIIETGAVTASWLVPLIVYSFTLAPGVTAGDSGDFIVAVHRFSLPHPPGYPLYMLLAKIWTIIPINLGADPFAVKMNMFSMVAMVVSCAIFYRLLKILTGSIAASLGSVMIFAFSRTVWKFALVTEVYALGVLLILLVLLGLAIASEGNPKGLILSAVSFGLGLAHHHSIILLVPLMVVLWPRGKDSARVKFPVLLACLILPLILYLLIPVMVARSPQYKESGFTFRDFIETVTRAEYRERADYQDLPPEQLVRSSDILDRATRYLPKQFGWFILAMCLAGWFIPPANRRIWGLMVAVTSGLWIFSLVYFSRGSPLGMPFSYLRSIDEFMIPVNIFLAMGFAWLLAPLSYRLTRKNDFAGTEGLNLIPREFVPVAIALLFCVPAIFLGMTNAKFSNQTLRTFVQDQARNVLEQVPENGVLVVSGDEIYLFEYLKEVRGIRRDVELVVYPFVRLVEAGGGQRVI
ncbi:MAG TPA: DUF2723 domain-containing protein, partial [Firmicutes bacterium]|nr:DUF2723 domain-containing protein [Bacillota bacterium]